MVLVLPALRFGASRVDQHFKRRSTHTGFQELDTYLGLTRGWPLVRKKLLIRVQHGLSLHHYTNGTL